MNLTILSVISFLFPLTVASFGAITLFGNKNRGLSRNLVSVIMVMLCYKFAYDILSAFELRTVQLIAYLLGIPLIFGIAPMIYKYFRSLLPNTYPLNGSLMKHFIPIAVVFALNLALVIYLDVDTFVDTLNSRFQNDRDFEDSLSTLILFISGTPLLFFQWLFYYMFLKRLISAQRKRFGKFYGSYEQRNEQLIKRIYVSFTGVFALSFLIVFFQVEDPMTIIFCNLVSGVLVIFSVLAAREQIDIRSYRMYKLSSHEAEIDEDVSALGSINS